MGSRRAEKKAARAEKRTAKKTAKAEKKSARQERRKVEGGFAKRTANAIRPGSTQASLARKEARTARANRRHERITSRGGDSVV